MKIPYNAEMNRIGRVPIPRTTLICPACSTEIGLTELIERKGYVGCINCSR